LQRDFLKATRVLLLTTETRFPKVGIALAISVVEGKVEVDGADIDEDRLKVMRID